jgi:tetraacyldisaccharide 4'-kinase
MILKKSLRNIKNLGEYKLILTTEKDYVRLKTFDYLREIVYYWPINVIIDKKKNSIKSS